MLIVSHDRDFLDRTVNLTLGLTGSGNVDIIVGGYADWEAKRDHPQSSESRRKAGKFTVESDNLESQNLAAPAPPVRTVKLSYKDQRDYDLLPARISQFDADIAAAEAEMSDPALYTRKPERFAALLKQVEAANAEKAAAEERWLELAMLVEG